MLHIYHGGVRDYLAEAQALHQSAIVLDGHADTPQRFADTEWSWTGDDLGLGYLSAETARVGGLDGGFMIAWPQPGFWDGRFAERTRMLMESIHQQARQNPESLRVCRTVADVRGARQQNVFAALIGVEGGHAIENSLENLREFHASGVRYMTLTWANDNDWCGSSGDHANHRGLSSFGREVVREMNQIGMLVDVSHVSDAAFWDVLETSEVPVIASHSSARALCAAPRNLTDEMVRALAQQGGIVMVNFFATFLSDTWRDGWNAQRPEREAALEAESVRHREQGTIMPYFPDEVAIERAFARRLPPVPFSVLVDHFDHMLRVAGPEHVGIGSDFDGIALSVEGMESAADLPKVTAGLLERGWSAQELRGMLGENLLRVMTAAEDFAGTQRAVFYKTA